MKKGKGAGKSIIATARKLAVIIWHMVNDDVEFDIGKMEEKKRAGMAEGMRKTPGQLAEEALVVGGKPAVTQIGKKSVKKAGVAREKRKKVG